MYKILVNMDNDKVIACGKIIVHQPEDISYLIDCEYGVGVHPQGNYGIFEVESHVEPQKYLYVDGKLELNPQYQPAQLEQQVNLMQQALDELLLGGM